MKAIIALLAFALAGCASVPARKTVTPPMPPGFKPGAITKASAPVARFAPASAEPTATPGTGIIQAPEIYNDPDYGRIFLARAYQGPNTELRVTGSTSLDVWGHVATFGCWPTEQVFLVATSVTGPYRFMRGMHVACAPTFAPASAARLGPSKDFKTKGGIVKAARVEGIDVAPGVTVWKVLP